VEKKRKAPHIVQGLDVMAGPTRLELATSGVTGQRSNQLNYDPANLSIDRRPVTGNRVGDRTTADRAALLWPSPMESPIAHTIADHPSPIRSPITNNRSPIIWAVQDSNL
jgi:hypothetical protein